jgi:hypothetical protein
MNETRAQFLEQLNTAVSQLLAFYRSIPASNVMVYELWSAKDVLAHHTFWHESFARNVSDIAANKTSSSHRMIEAHILNPAIHLIPYRKGTRNYTPEEHLKVVINHVNRHLRDVSRAS